METDGKCEGMAQGEGIGIVFKKPFRGDFNGDEIHCLLRLRREGSPERLSRS